MDRKKGIAKLPAIQMVLARSQQITIDRINQYKCPVLYLASRWMQIPISIVQKEK